MSPLFNTRFSASLLLLGSALGLVAHIFHIERPDNPAQFAAYAQAAAPVHVLLFFAVLLFLMGLPAMLAAQRGRAGVVAAVALAVFGLLVGLGDMAHCVLEFSAVPAFAAARPAEALALMKQIEGYELPAMTMASTALGVGGMLAYPLFALLALRARTLPRWPALLMFAFMAVTALSMLQLIPQELGDLMIGVGFYIPFLAYAIVILAATRSLQAKAVLAAQTA